MPTIIFETEHGQPVAVEAAAGGPLVDVCDANATPVPFSCRSADCGTCCVHVVAGADMLDPPASDELAVLEVLGESPAQARLACQAIVRPGMGLLRLRVPDY